MEQQNRIPGYTGYKPQFENENDPACTGQVRDNRFYIPGKYTPFLL